MKIKLAFIFLLVPFFISCKNNNIYSDLKYWAISENENKNKIDTFFINTTSVTKKNTNNEYNMSFGDEICNQRFYQNVISEKGLYDAKTNFYAPYYRQTVIESYTQLNRQEREIYINIAYEDVKNAFDYYLKNINKGNGIILAGFSQGADLALRLVKDFSKDKSFTSKLVCCYAIGWQVSDEYLNKLSNDIHFATCDKDINSIVSFDCENAKTNENIILFKAEKTNSINPLTWTRDNNLADESLNIGAKFYNSHGEDITSTKPRTKFSARIKENRGTIEVNLTDDKIDQDNFPCKPFDYGYFHVYDWQFFYSNIKENVLTRINTYLNK